ncbi:MAG: HIT family protein [Pseudomonadota bacterium]
MELANCIFCKIASGAVPSVQVWSDEEFVAFLDANPIREGHLQLIPRQHFAYFDDLPPELASRFILAGQSLATRLKRVFDVPRVAFVCTGGDVAHCHAHLVPLHEKTDITSLRYFEPAQLVPSTRKRPTVAQLSDVAAKLV